MVPSSLWEASRVEPGVRHHIAFFSLRQISLCLSLVTLVMAFRAPLDDPGSCPTPRSLITFTKSLLSWKVRCLQILGIRASLGVGGYSAPSGRVPGPGHFIGYQPAWGTSSIHGGQEVKLWDTTFLTTWHEEVLQERSGCPSASVAPGLQGLPRTRSQG